ncbi:MAG: hypothetical protein RMJ81_01880, partial [Candidatus Kryptonium sp.]|nr:hypothetical protein [Candidatus Kryptonium sp.]
MWRFFIFFSIITFGYSQSLYVVDSYLKGDRYNVPSVDELTTRFAFSDDLNAVVNAYNQSPVEFAPAHGEDHSFIKIPSSLSLALKRFLLFDFNPLGNAKVHKILRSQMEPFTVRSKLNVATSTATTFANDVRLRGIGANEFGEISNDAYDGKVFFAEYLFYSPSRGRYVNVRISATGEAQIDTSEIPIRPTRDLPATFIDSDSAFKVAEANGGRTYRIDPNAITAIMYELRNFNEPFPPAPDSANPYWRLMYVKLDRNTPSLDNPVGVLVFYLNPLNGRVVMKYEFLVRPITAKERFGSVDSVAKSYASDARLMYVLGAERFSGFEIPTDTVVDGKCYLWNYGYSSTSKGRFSVFLIFGIPTIDTFWVPFSFTMPLDFRRYFDSDTLVKVAEANGGSQFRREHEVSELAYLYSQSLLLPIAIHFHSFYQGTDSATGKVRQLIVLVDPTTGRYVQRITEVQKDKVAGVPTDFALHQNYPNPFNPS